MEPGSGSEAAPVIATSPPHVAGDHQGAVAFLEPVSEHLAIQGIQEPGAFPVAPGLVQALVGAGRLHDAEAFTARLALAAEALEHPWAAAAVIQARAHLLTPTPTAEAAELFRSAAEAYRALGCRHVQAHCLMLAGSVLRRLRRRREARELLDDAFALFEEAGSPGWAALVDAERSRLSGRRSAGGALTPAEQRIAAEVAAGLHNREVAEKLVVAEATVEAALSRIYAKLGIRSRTELAVRFTADASPQVTPTGSGRPPP